ncbi:unnamed protein product [Caenorhabditis angaria]|uniref:Uncharacterized protein n=1 Tax=Caenorhabditis angaria TaxID=860376 RepID=A0A9P1J0Z0_9PELO|nr:unnamed protein product [Caenorhabditis angaria]
MPNLLATASQVANSLSNLKAKYIKYLESLCNSNGIDISTLKNEGTSHFLLEMYFGGLPVLVGLKYFSNLKCLRLFGQQIICLKPLGEIAPTLEELWICEGVVKDLTGIENCIRLKKLYLYENSIEDAYQIQNLICLQVLDISENRLKNLQFLRNLKDLTNFSAAGNKMRDSVIITVAWPENIQHLDISDNSFSSCKSLFGLTILHSLRSLHLNLAFSNISMNLFFSWISHSFRFLESIDDDRLAECFAVNYRPMIDTIFADKISRIAKINEKITKDLRLAEKHSTKIENRLACLAEALAVFRDSMQTKDAKKEIVKRVQEICSNNSKAVKSVKKNYNTLCEFYRSLAKYRIACEMESCQTFELRDATEDEILVFTQTLNYNCSMKNCYEINIKSCSIVNEISKPETEKLFILEKDANDQLFENRSIFQLLDRFSRANYMFSNNSVKIIRDFEILKKQSKDKTMVYFLPLVLSKMSKGGEDGIGNSNEIGWKDIKLCAILAVEIHPVGQLTTDQLRWAIFREKLGFEVTCGFEVFKFC